MKEFLMKILSPQHFQKKPRNRMMKFCGSSNMAVALVFANHQQAGIF